MHRLVTGLILSLAAAGAQAQQAKPAQQNPAASAKQPPASTAAKSPSSASSASAEAHVDQLIKALKTDDSFKVRLQAAVFLGRSGDARAVDPLLDALTNDAHYTVRAAAAMALANLGEPRAISRILHALAMDPDDFVRAEAARALKKYSRAQALPYVVATYGSEDSLVRQQVLKYLAAGSFDGAEPVFTRALGDTPDIFAIAKKAIMALPEQQRIDFLKQAVDNREPEVRRGAVEVLHAIDDKAATDVILSVYNRDIEVDEVRDATRSALRDMRNFLDINKIVQDAVSSPDKHVRAKSLKLLGVVGGKRAEGALLSALKDEDIYLRGTAVMAMRELGDPSVVPSLEKLVGDPANQRIAHLVRHTLKQLRKQQANK